jgi:hypothetical protein
MFIQTENTPNPNAIKFIPGRLINDGNPLFFNNVEEAALKSTLAVKIFDIGNINGVFYGKDFITVTKSDDYDWSLLKPEILMVIMDHIVSGFPIFETHKIYRQR